MIACSGPWRRTWRCQDPGAIIQQYRGCRDVETFEQVLERRRGVSVLDAQYRRIGHQASLEPGAGNPRLDDRFAVLKEVHLSGMDRDINGRGNGWRGLVIRAGFL